MKNTKLIKLLRTFSPAEMKKFRDFTASPFFNKNQNIIKLCDTLVKFHPGFEHKNFTEDAVYAQVFGDEKFDYFRIRNVSSDLYNLALEFLKHIPNPGTEFTGEYNLIVQLRLRKLFDLHKKIVKNNESRNNNIEVKGSEFLYDNYLLTREIQLIDLFEKPSSISGILAEFESCYEFLIFHLLQYYNLMIHIGKENNVNIEIKMMDEVLSYLEKGPVSTHPSTLAYQYLILLKQKGSEEYYFKLKEHYFSNFEKMDASAAYRAHMHMFGYCADMYNFKGDRRFVKEGYELYRHSYLHGRVTSGELLYPDFVNFIKVFVRAGDTSLARKFIEDYKDKLPADQLDNSLDFSYAYIAHYEGDLEKALRHISKVNFPLVILKVQVKILEIQLNYQLSYFEETRSLIESFKRTLAKEVIVSEDYKNSIQGFLKHTMSLINLKHETNSKTKEFESARLADLVKSAQPNHFGIKFWLKDRLKEI